MKQDKLRVHQTSSARCVFGQVTPNTYKGGPDAQGPEMNVDCLMRAESFTFESLPRVRSESPGVSSASYVAPSWHYVTGQLQLARMPA